MKNREPVLHLDREAVPSRLDLCAAPPEGDWRQWIADVYHCSDCWGEKMTVDDMRVMLTESAREKDPDDYSPDPSLAAACAACWNELCDLYPN